MKSLIILAIIFSEIVSAGEESDRPKVARTTRDTPYNKWKKSYGVGEPEGGIAPIAQGEGYFIQYINGLVIHIDRNSGASKTLLWSGTFTEMNRAQRRYTIKLLHVKADKERIYAISEDGSETKLFILWQSDGSLLKSYTLKVLGIGAALPAIQDGILYIGPEEPAPITLDQNSLSYKGAKIHFDGKKIVKVEHHPERK